MSAVIDLLDFIKQYWAIFVFVVGTFWGMLKLTINAQYVRQADLKALKTEVSGMHERLTKVEQTVKGLPSANEIADLKIIMTELKGDTKTLTASVNGLKHQVNLLIEKEIKK